MYYAYDSHAADLPGALETAIHQRLARHPGSRFSALIDCAFAPSEVAELLIGTPAETVLSLYADTPLKDCEELAPILVQLPSDHTERLAAVARWLALCDGKPMLSFIASGLSITELKRHFSAFLQVSDDDGMHYALRFADVCMTPDILDCLQPEQRETWLNGMYDWWIIARDGALQRLGGTNATPVAATPNEWFGQQIGNAGVMRLFRKNEADYVLNYLDEMMLPVFRNFRRSEAYRKTVQLLEQLDRQNIHDRVIRDDRVISLFQP
jgi:hypothetical protein